MSLVKLFNISTKKIVDVNNVPNEIIIKIFNKELRIPNSTEVNNHDEIMNILSDITDNIPLFSIHHKNMFLIKKENVYFRVMYNNFRFPDSQIIDLIKQSEYPNKTDIIDFISQFDTNILHQSYRNAFLNSSPSITNDILTCIRPSFISRYSHLKPYYTRNELIALGKNNNLSYNSLENLCNVVKNNDISSKILAKHQKYIIDSDASGLLKFYTLQGSGIINEYLRGFKKYYGTNTYLTDIIEPIWKLVLNSPEFDKSYYLYRFINSDNHISHLKVGDIFVEKGFMSTTRDPFYMSDFYQFGMILMKIKIPENTKGVALCIELISHFSAEQEIIFPPMTYLKLVNKDNNVTYYHTDSNRTAQIKTKYEFEFVGSGEVSFNNDEKSTQQLHPINFIKLKSNAIEKKSAIYEKIKSFTSKYLDPSGGFNVNLDQIQLHVFTEFYDSTKAYKPFYAMSITDGFGLYSFYKNYMIFYIEIGERDNLEQIHVNFQLKYTRIERQKIISDETFLQFIASIGYYFDIPNIIIHSDYISCNKSTNVYKNTKTDNFIIDSSFYSLDIYEYLTIKKKRFDTLNLSEYDITPMFRYHGINSIDDMSNIDVNMIIDQSDRDELYQFFHNVYSKIGENNVASFYVYLVQNECWLVNFLVSKLDRYFYKKNTMNPFKNVMYVLKPHTFLYNRSLIYDIGDEVVNINKLVQQSSDFTFSTNSEYREVVEQIKKKYLNLFE